VTAKGEKLFRRMKASKADWSSREVLIVYEWLGFRTWAGTNHDRFQHPDFPELIGTVKRGTAIATGYIETLLQHERQLREAEAAKLKEEEQGGQK
jgi:hypothetical protein